MKRIHIAITTQDLAATVQDYSVRFGIWPCIIIPGEYALWRTEIFNFSVRHDLTRDPGELRHLGWEDEVTEALPRPTAMASSGNASQGTEINQIWPYAQYVPDKV